MPFKDTPQGTTHYCGDGCMPPHILPTTSANTNNFNMVKNKLNQNEKYESEEWGGWKIVSDMLDSPTELGIYHTSECYKKLYEFVVEQKQKARQEAIESMLGKIKPTVIDFPNEVKATVDIIQSILDVVWEKQKEKIIQTAREKWNINL